MKGEKRLKLLEILCEAPTLLEELFIIFTSPYGSSGRKIENRILKHYENRQKAADSERERRKFNDIVYRLKKDNLIEAKKKNNQTNYSITTFGKKILRKLKLAKQKSLPNIEYKKEEDNQIKIIIFDIPEEQSKKSDGCVVLSYI